MIKAFVLMETEQDSKYNKKTHPFGEMEQKGKSDEC